MSGGAKVPQHVPALCTLSHHHLGQGIGYDALFCYYADEAVGRCRVAPVTLHVRAIKPALVLITTPMATAAGQAAVP